MLDHERNEIKKSLNIINVSTIRTKPHKDQKELANHEDKAWLPTQENIITNTIDNIENTEEEVIGTTLKSRKVHEPP